MRGRCISARITVFALNWTLLTDYRPEWYQHQPGALSDQGPLSYSTHMVTFCSSHVTLDPQWVAISSQGKRRKQTDIRTCIPTYWCQITHHACLQTVGRTRGNSRRHGKNVQVENHTPNFVTSKQQRQPPPKENSRTIIDKRSLGLQKTAYFSLCLQFFFCQAQKQGSHVTVSEVGKALGWWPYRYHSKSICAPFVTSHMAVHRNVHFSPHFESKLNIDNCQTIDTYYCQTF